MFLSSFGYVNAFAGNCKKNDQRYITTKHVIFLVMFLQKPMFPVIFSHPSEDYYGNYVSWPLVSFCTHKRVYDITILFGWLSQFDSPSCFECVKDIFIFGA